MSPAPPRSRHPVTPLHRCGVRIPFLFSEEGKREMEERSNLNQPNLTSPYFYPPLCARDNALYPELPSPATWHPTTIIITTASTSVHFVSRWGINPGWGWLRREGKHDVQREEEVQRARTEILLHNALSCFPASSFTVTLAVKLNLKMSSTCLEITWGQNSS